MKTLSIKTRSDLALERQAREELNDYIHRIYKTISYLVLKEGYTFIAVEHDLYIAYAVSLIKERFGVGYEIQLFDKQLRSLSDFPDPILAMKALLDADHIRTASAGQKKRLLTRYTRDWIIQYEMQQSGLSPIEAAQRYRIHIGDKTFAENSISVLST